MKEGWLPAYLVSMRHNNYSVMHHFQMSGKTVHRLISLGQSSSLLSFFSCAFINISLHLMFNHPPPTTVTLKQKPFQATSQQQQQQQNCHRKTVFQFQFVYKTIHLSLTPSLPWCHLKTTNKSVKSETLKPFCFRFCTGMWKDLHQNA